MHILSINNLTKQFGSLTAVNNLSLDIPQGTIFGILGPNGSGKSTTLGILLGIIHATSGTFSWFNAPNQAKQRQNIGTLLENPNFYPYLNAVQNLKITCLIKDVPFNNIDRVLELVKLADRKKSKIKTFSLGMKQRLAVANALLADPEVLVLDEPTNGLDPQGIKEMREIILEVGQQGKTILLASHILDEVEKTCSDVAILKKGNLLSVGSVETIIGKGNRVKLTTDQIEKARSLLSDCYFVKQIKILNEKQLLVFINEIGSSFLLNKYLMEQNLIVEEIYEVKHTLEDQFLKLTN